MNTFIGIGCNHWKDSYDYVSSVLQKEKPDLVLVEYGICNVGAFDTEPGSLLCKRVEEGKAEAHFDLSKEQEPKIYLDDIMIFDSRAPSEAAAGVGYALNRSIPVFLINEPFRRAKGFSETLRNKGIIGFESKEKQGYRIILTQHDKTAFTQRTFNFLKQRNYFFKDAIEVLDDLYKPSTVASVGGLLHYSVGTNESCLLEPGYASEFTFTALVNAKKKVIYDAAKMKRVK